MSWGAKMCLNSEKGKELFKDAINRNTACGSHFDSGDYLRGEINPMCDYDTQSVVNVLKNELLINPDAAFSGIKTSEKKTYYRDSWL